MFKQNLLITLRGIKRYKSAFFINLFGLSTGLACTLLIYLWVNDELQMDKFHKKDAQLYQVMEHQQYAEDVMSTRSTPGLLAESLKADYPEVEYAATTTWIGENTLTAGESNLKAEGYHVGPDYFNIFSYELLQGTADQVLQDKKSIVISDKLAVDLFGDVEKALGQMVEVQHADEFQVTGIFKEIPRNSSYRFDYVLSFEFYKDDNEWVLNWGSNGPSTYMIITEGANPDELSEKIADFVTDKGEQTNVTLFLKKYSTMYLHGRFENGVQSGGRIEYVRLFSIIAAFILIIACINFMNLSTARASRRAKEVGIKKAVGAQRKSLVSQFMVESVMISFLSLVLALTLVWLLIPFFNQLTDKQIAIVLSPSLVGWSLAITAVAGFLAGSYPALYLSGFSPSRVLKGEVKTSVGELWVRRGLVVFQFCLSVILIVSVTVVYQQIQFAQTKNLGYNKDNVITIPIEGEIDKNLEIYLSQISNVPGVINASSIGHSLVGQQNNTSGLDWEGKNPEDKILFENMRSNYNIFQTMGIEFRSGRAFTRDHKADTAAIIFNDAAIKVMGLKAPLEGQVIDMWGGKRHIIGVVKDFHFQSLHNEISPAFFTLNPNYNWNVMARIDGKQVAETLDRVKRFTEEFNPGFTFDYKFLDETYARQYSSEQRVASLSKYFAGFAILISCLGLFGLAAFTTERRMKEIGTRKALGASARSIMMLVTKEFTNLVLVAILIAIPFSYVIANLWLQKFAFRIDLEIWFFVGSGILALLVAGLTVSSQALRAARVNPVDCLRDE